MLIEQAMLTALLMLALTAALPLKCMVQTVLMTR
jgi:hypothetical protein